MKASVMAGLGAAMLALPGGIGGAEGQGLPEAPAEMEALAWLVGEWEGEGGIEQVPGQRGEFRGTERVEERMASRDGENWRQFFEMELTRTGPTRP